VLVYGFDAAPFEVFGELDEAVVGVEFAAEG